MNKIVIRSPRWKSPRSIGVAETKLDFLNKIEIAYRTKDKQKLYPHPFLLPRDQAMKCPVQVVKGVRLRLVPIAEMAVML